MGHESLAVSHFLYKQRITVAWAAGSYLSYAHAAGFQTQTHVSVQSQILPLHVISSDIQKYRVCSCMLNVLYTAINN